MKPAFALASCALLLLFVASPASARPQPQHQTPAGSRTSITADLSKGPSFTFQIAPDLAEFTFKVIPDVEPEQAENAQAIVQDIEVFRGSAKQPLQRLTGCEWSAMEPPPTGSNWFRAEDINFDGYRDIYLMTMWGATGNELGCVWLYNPVSGRFDYSKEFSELPGYQLELASRTILTFANGGMAGMVHSASKYKVEHNRPVLIWSEVQDWDSQKNQFHCIVKERRRGGSLATVRDEWGGSEDRGGPCDPNRLFENPEATPARTKAN